MAGTDRLDLKSALLFASGTALAWVVLFRLNAWLFASAGATAFASWVFLPAALRLVSVLLLGFPAALGLMAGTFYTCDPVLRLDDWQAIGISALSGLGPWVAVLLSRRLLRLPEDLEGLAPRHLAVLSLMGAACNVAPHITAYHLLGKTGAPLTDAIPMFAGDVTGTWIVLYLAALVFKVRH